MTVAQKLQTIAENTPRLCQAERERLWDVFTKNNTRTNYTYAFSRTDVQHIRPPYKIVPTERGSLCNTFMYCDKLERVEAAYFDFSQVPRGNYESQGIYYTFTTCRSLEEIEDVGFPVPFAYSHSFAYCGALRKIACIRCDKDTIFNNTFLRCLALEDITFEGVIGKSISFADCGMLSHTSVQGILDHLADLTGKDAQTLTLHPDISLTEVQKSTLTAKNWRLN